MPHIATFARALLPPRHHGEGGRHSTCACLSAPLNLGCTPTGRAVSRHTAARSFWSAAEPERAAVASASRLRRAAPVVTTAAALRRRGGRGGAAAAGRWARIPLGGLPQGGGGRRRRRRRHRRAAARPPCDAPTTGPSSPRSQRRFASTTTGSRHRRLGVRLREPWASRCRCTASVQSASSAGVGDGAWRVRFSVAHRPGIGGPPPPRSEDDRSG